MSNASFEICTTYYFDISIDVTTCNVLFRYFNCQLHSNELSDNWYSSAVMIRPHAHITHHSPSFTVTNDKINKQKQISTYTIICCGTTARHSAWTNWKMKGPCEFIIWCLISINKTHETHPNWAITQSELIFAATIFLIILIIVQYIIEREQFE